MSCENILQSLTFDDILLLPSKSDVLPKDIDVSTLLSRNIRLNTPLVSAAMDTVTESQTAISMAQSGGIGIIHKNMSIEAQALEVKKVKKYESGMIIDPITVSPDQKIGDALDIMEKNQISGFPVEKNGKLVGIITNRDLRFESDFEKRISDVMTRENLITASPGITLDEARKVLHKNRIEKLLVVDEKGNLAGLITVKDIEKAAKFPNSCKDDRGRLRVGAAVGISDDRQERIQELINAGADVIVIDTAHAHTVSVLKAIQSIRSDFSDCELIAGNIATAEAAEDLIKAGCDAIKVGIGPGSICTTRIIAGIGVPQITAIMNCRKIADKHGIPVIADGGVKFSGDITKAIAAGANSVMVGNLFAGTDESPGEIIFFQGRTYKVYRGMGSLEAMKKGGRERYFQHDVEDEAKLVPEGIEGRVPYRGNLSSIVFQLIGGLRSGMGYTGCRTINDLRHNARFIQITNSGLTESHVHNIVITKEAPNYRLE